MRFPKTSLLLFASVLLAVGLAACGAPSSGTQSGSSATSQATNALPHIVDISPTEKMAFIPASDRSAAPAGTPAIINGWVSLSLAVNGVPCVNCVGSPPIGDTLGIAFPQPYLPLKSTYEITYTFYNVSEGTSSCSLTFHFKQGTTSLLSNTSTITLNGNGQYVYYIGGPLSTKAHSGPGTVSADVKCNGFAPKAATQTVYLY